jgi:phage terminase large subunit-like protein
MTLHWEEPEQGKKLMNELCSKMVDEYYFGVEPSGDLVIMLDGRYFPVSNSTDVLSYNITAGSSMGHAYLMHLTNDRTQEKR